MSDKGAHFFRCDLQVHSPRDVNWIGPDAVTNEERRTYARELVQACRERGLQGIAITDHHDMLFARYIRDAAQEETNQDGTPLPELRRMAFRVSQPRVVALPRYGSLAAHVMAYRKPPQSDERMKNTSGRGDGGGVGMVPKVAEGGTR